MPTALRPRSDGEPAARGPDRCSFRPWTLPRSRRSSTSTRSGPARTSARSRSAGSTSTASCAASTCRSTSSGTWSSTGFGFCDVIFGWDIGDVLYDNAKVTGWDTGYPDAHATIDPSTAARPARRARHRDVPRRLRERRTAAAHPACPRSLLKRVLARAAKRGYTATFGSEFEFWVFKETPESLHEKGFREPHSRSAPGMFGYSWVREDQNRAFCHAILDEMTAMRHRDRGAPHRDGPRRLRGRDPLRRGAPRRRQGRALQDAHEGARDAPRPLRHVHGEVEPRSPRARAGTCTSRSGASRSTAPPRRTCSTTTRASRSSPQTARHYLAGQLALMPELTALYSPTINSYKRYVPGVWAPLTASWGAENRTCAIRVDPRWAELDAPRVPADRGRHQPVHRHGDVPRRGPLRHRARSSSRRPPGKGDASTSKDFKRAAAHAEGGDGAGSRRARAHARSSARPSSTTTCARASGRCASSSASSPSGSCSATSSRSEPRSPGRRSVGRP